LLYGRVCFYEFNVCAAPEMIAKDARRHEGAERGLMEVSKLRPTVLNVDDSQANRCTTSRILQRAGFDVLEATDGKQALELSQSRPDVVLLGMQLPDLTGLEVCQRIKAQESTASVAVLMTSASHAGVESEVLGVDHGADAWLAQPFEAAELVALVRSLWRMRQAEQDSREHSQRLVDADRRKDEFLAMLAHELRNPLAAATTALYLLEKDSIDQRRRQRAREVIRRQLGNLGKLVDDLLDVSRVTRGKIELRKEAVDLTALLQGLVQLGHERWAVPRGQQLDLVVPEARVLVFGDAMRLEQIFDNLLDNASKYSERGGRITLTLTNAGELCSVCVRDDGIGLAPDAVPNVFSLFYQADHSFARAGGGLGIGLTLVRTLVELHGGSVMARSGGIGKGSELEVRLPSLAAPRPHQI
jgi:signal transduction histidine kinase